MISSSRIAYLRSLSRELDVQAARVRELIGNSHWGSDGTHKEALLGGLLQRHIPTGYLISKGFVVSESDSDACSREQDLLIVDTSIEAPAFAQHGLVVAFPDQVRAAISVKSEYGSATLRKAFADLSTVAAVSPPTLIEELWLGLYFFPQSADSPTLAKLLAAIRDAASELARRRAIAEIVVRVNPDTLARCSFTTSAARGWVYKAQDLATSCFLARLLSWLAAKRNGAASFDALMAELNVDSSQCEQCEL